MTTPATFLLVAANGAVLHGNTNPHYLRMFVAGDLNDAKVIEVATGADVTAYGTLPGDTRPGYEVAA